MMIEQLLKDWDGETVVVRYDRPTGAWIFIAIHSTRLGPATGGTRMKSYPNSEAALDDVLKLAVGMTYKFAVPAFPRGGGKAVIAIPDDFDPQSCTDLLRRYGKLIQQLGGLFYTGPDVGTSSTDMDIIAETCAPYIHIRTPSAGGPHSSAAGEAPGAGGRTQIVTGRLTARTTRLPTGTEYSG